MFVVDNPMLSKVMKIDMIVSQWNVDDVSWQRSERIKWIFVLNLRIYLFFLFSLSLFFLSSFSQFISFHWCQLSMCNWEGGYAVFIRFCAYAFDISIWNWTRIMFIFVFVRPQPHPCMGILHHIYSQFIRKMSNFNKYSCVILDDD